MAAGYDISASASTSSGSGTGAVKFGNVNIGSGVGGSSSPISMIWIVVAGVAGLLLWLIFRRRKKR